MASLAKEKGKYYRIHWKFVVTAGPQAGQTIEGSLYLGRCARAAARARLRELETWEEAVKTGRHLPKRHSRGGRIRVARHGRSVPASDAHIGGRVETLLLVGLAQNRRGPHAVTTAKIDTSAELIRTAPPLRLLGASMPYDDKQFVCAVVGGVSNVMPESVLCRILQETLRVATHVMIYVPRAPHQGHVQQPPTCPVPRPYWCKRFYFSNELEDFEFGRKRILRTGTLVHVKWAPRMKSIMYGHDTWYVRHPLARNHCESRYANR